MSGAFGDLARIVKKRISEQEIGFGAKIKNSRDDRDILQKVKAEDLIEFGFETEFVGRLPVRAVFEKLDEEDLFEILKNPSNPIILGKKLDFAAYGIDVKFENKALRILAKKAFNENTGARGLVSAVEGALLLFEKKLPSSDIKIFPVTVSVIENPEKSLENMMLLSNRSKLNETFEELAREEKKYIITYLDANKKNLAEKYGLTLTPSRIEVVASYYSTHTMDIEKVINKIKSYYDDIKKIELIFFKNNDINIVLEDDAVDFIIEQFEKKNISVEDYYEQMKGNFKHGLNLIREKTGKNRFFITRSALLNPEGFISKLYKDELSHNLLPDV
jgi:hypothetical protein